jgi:hypothetical protein
MSRPKPANSKIGVRISKETGGAYADIREVIESEIARIRAERATKADDNRSIRRRDFHDDKCNVDKPR